MSAKALFTPGGDYHTPVVDRIAELPRGQRAAALAVWNAIVAFLGKGKTELWITDRMLHRSPWLCSFGLRFIQKGLHALEFGKSEIDKSVLGLIKRKRGRGLRTIIVVARLRGRVMPTPPKPDPRIQGAGAKPVPAVSKAPEPRPMSAEEEQTERRKAEEWKKHFATAARRGGVHTPFDPGLPPQPSGP